MKRMLLSFLLLLVGCTSAAPPATPQLVAVYSTSAAQPWLTPLYACAGSLVALSRVDDADSAEITLRVGEPRFLDLPAYRIGQEEIWVTTHRESLIPTMDLEQVQVLFAGFGDPAIQVWVYSSDNDVQQVFDQVVMKGRTIGASAHVAANPQQVVNVLESERQAVGILPLSWSMKMSGSGGIYHVATVPVLAITKSEPQGVIRELIACLQK